MTPPQENPKVPFTGEPTLEEFIAVLTKIRMPLRHVTTAPTFIPQTWLDHFVTYDDGVNFRLYTYVNGTWRYAALT